MSTMMGTRHLLAAIALMALGGCSAGALYDDLTEPYSQRSQTITLTAGNAKEANAAIHVIDPWPSYVYNTRIPGDGQRMAEAVERYEDVSKLSKAPKPISPVYGSNIGLSAATAQ
jgi:hypothetical protein